MNEKDVRQVAKTPRRQEKKETTYLLGILGAFGVLALIINSVSQMASHFKRASAPPCLRGELNCIYAATFPVNPRPAAVLGVCSAR
jgi:hypothetical protein